MRDNPPMVRQVRVPTPELRDNPALSPECGALLRAYPLPDGAEFSTRRDGNRAAPVLRREPWTPGLELVQHQAGLEALARACC